MLSPSANDPKDQLQSILCGAENGAEFLSGLSKLAAAAVSEESGDTVQCAVTVKAGRRPDTAALLCVQTRRVHPKVYEKAVGFAAAAHNALHLSVRIVTAVNRAEDLDAAMHSRTAIDLACGVIMAQNRCSQAEAMKILSKVSSNRNRKLRDVAAELVERLSGHSIQTHFDA